MCKLVLVVRSRVVSWRPFFNQIIIFLKSHRATRAVLMSSPIPGGCWLFYSLMARHHFLAAMFHEKCQGVHEAGFNSWHFPPLSLGSVCRFGLVRSPENCSMIGGEQLCTTNTTISKANEPAPVSFGPDCRCREGTSWLPHWE